MELNQWIIYGEVGTSSKTMWAAITGVATSGRMGGNFDVPYDGDDFSRCYKLWIECNITAEQLDRVKNIFPWWAPFIDNWATLVRMYVGNEPMYEFIKPLVNEARVLDGWVKISPNLWERTS